MFVFPPSLLARCTTPHQQDYVPNAEPSPNRSRKTGGRFPQRVRNKPQFGAPKKKKKCAILPLPRRTDGTCVGWVVHISWDDRWRFSCSSSPARCHLGVRSRELLAEVSSRKNVIEIWGFGKCCHISWLAGVQFVGFALSLRFVFVRRSIVLAGEIAGEMWSCAVKKVFLERSTVS